MQNIIEAKTADFSAAIAGEQLTIVDFWAPWCGYCVRMMPLFEELAAEYDGKVKFIKVNTDEEPQLAMQYKIEVLPTFAFMKNGEIVDRKIGFVPKEDMKKAIEAAL